MYAAIDVGSNTVRALVGRLDSGRIEPMTYYREVTRLGGDFCDQTGLHPSSIERTVKAIKTVAAQLKQHPIEGCRVVGTEALRRASNASTLMQQVQSSTGFELEVIAGEEEARLSAAGILSALDPVPDYCLFFDLGGGSTEIGLVRRGRLIFFKSYPLGVVRQAEENPHQKDRIAFTRQIFNQVKRDLQQQVGLLPATLACVGTAGTVTTLAALDQQMADYQWQRINNYRMTTASVRQWHQKLQSLFPVQRAELPGMEAGRVDLIVPGCEVIEAVLDLCNAPELIVSDFGLLEGVLLDQVAPI